MTDRMRIAIVGPPWFEIPPRTYGGIELMCYYLTNGLVARGHDVTLVAAGPNKTQARFVQTFPEPPSARLGESLPEILHTAHTATALAQGDFEIVHDHSFAGPLLSFARKIPTVVTAHGPVDGEIGDYYRAFPPNAAMVAISRAQTRLAPDIKWAGVVHNAIPVAEYPTVREKSDYAAFLGRMSPEKGVHLAIDAAREAQFPLIIAGKCTEPAELAYFEKEIRPRLGDGVEFIGEADAPIKKELLSNARCLVFPIQWQEPFGIVMVEALACGTPVVALRGGAVDEIVDHDVTGYVCDEPADLPEAIKRSDLIDPISCRRRAEEMFDVSTMVAGYESIYRKIIGTAGDGL